MVSVPSIGDGYQSRAGEMAEWVEMQEVDYSGYPVSSDLSSGGMDVSLC